MVLVAAVPGCVIVDSKGSGSFKLAGKPGASQPSPSRIRANCFAIFKRLKFVKENILELNGQNKQ